MVISFISIMAYISSAYAFFPSGEINENYSYKDLKIEKVEKKKVKYYLTGIIINETDERKEDFWITFYAKTIHGDTLWKVKVKIDLIDRYGTYDFEEKIKRYKKREPYKWEFKIKEPKKRKKK